MSFSGTTFRWLDILENEFDRAFVELDILLTQELDPEQCHIISMARDKMTILCSAFAQLADKAQTIFQTNAKLEAQIYDTRQSLIECEAQRDVMDTEHRRLLFLHHEKQLKDRVEEKDPLAESILSSLTNEKGALSSSVFQEARLNAEVKQLRKENEQVKEWFIGVQSELFGAQLAAKYLDKELAGRIQQIQLLARDPKGEHHRQLWDHLEAEINLHRHKTIVQACRQQNYAKYRRTQEKQQKRNTLSKLETTTQSNGHISQIEFPGVIQEVKLLLEPEAILGLEISGGKERGKPIHICEVKAGSVAAVSGAFRVGDVILSVNGINIDNLNETEVAQLLHKSGKSVILQLLVDDSNREHETGDNSKRHELDGIIRQVELHKEVSENLGLTITGGYENGVPILISDIHERSLAAKCGQFVIGDAILSANGADLRHATHEQAAEILRSLEGNLVFELLFVDADSDCDSVRDFDRDLWKEGSQMTNGSLKALSPRSTSSQSGSRNSLPHRTRFPGHAVEITDRFSSKDNSAV